MRILNFWCIIKTFLYFLVKMVACLKLLGLFLFTLFLRRDESCVLSQLLPFVVTMIEQVRDSKFCFVSHVSLFLFDHKTKYDEVLSIKRLVILKINQSNQLNRFPNFCACCTKIKMSIILTWLIGNYQKNTLFYIKFGYHLTKIKQKSKPGKSEAFGSGF